MTSVARACAAALLLVAAATSSPASANAVEQIPDTSADARATPDAGLRVRAYPKYGKAPVTMRIQAVVEPAAENRELEFVIDSGGYYRSSTIELRGAGAARVHAVQFRSLPAGKYQVVVALRVSGGAVRAVLRDEVMVLE